MPFSKILNDLAYTNFKEATAKIDLVKKGIQNNRMGEASLTDMQTDSDKLSKRIERENMPISVALERINGVPNFQDIHTLYKILKISESVGRITIKTRYGNSGYGTGFLVAPGILITNNHVFPDAETAQNSIVQFFYELDDTGETKKLQTFGFRPDQFFHTSSYIKDDSIPGSGLDYTLVAIAEKSKEGKYNTEIPHTVLDETLGKIIEGENCVVIQHPKGDYKKTVMKDIRMLTLKDDFLIYESDTLPGSSGAAVIGLGTGEIVALHHSSIPNKNPQGQWLRKDGGVYKDGDPDESIDWLGNEGIRVSSLIRSIRNANLTEEMSTIRNRFFGSHPPDHPSKKSSKQVEEIEIDPMKNSQDSVLNQAVNLIQTKSNSEEMPLQYFEIELSNIAAMQEDWKENYKRLAPEIATSEPLFPFSTIPSQRIIQYLSYRSTDNPWEIAAKLEALPQIKTVTPDLELETDLQMKSNSVTQTNESDAVENMKTSNAMGRQDDFKTKWSASTYFTLDDGDVANQRNWNRIAVGLTLREKETDLKSLLENILKKEDDEKKSDRARIALNHLQKINLVQMDTGYTDHAKVKGRFNFDCDEDFLDGSDARDETLHGLLKHPGHGTRTASVITGGNMEDVYKNDGNYGLLCDDQKNTLLNIIPYRISESVISINRAKNIVDAVNLSIHTNADIILFSLGTTPRPMIAEAAKAAYDNGVIWICSAGNEVEMVVSPAIYPGTIAVAATNPNQKPWRGSSYGSEVDVSAPGEDIYVPSMDEKFNEIMVYSSSTSYAAAHVAAAAAIWKAKNKEEINARYKFPWQTVEAFRICVKASATTPPLWDSENYGAGILNIKQLLEMELPEIPAEDYAYYSDARQEWDLGVREGVHFLWRTLLQKPIFKQESSQEMQLTERARIAISAMTGNTASSIFESDNATALTDTEKILHMHFDSYKKN